MDGQTGIMRKLVVAFHNFSNTPQIYAFSNVVAEFYENSMEFCENFSIQLVYRIA